MQPTSSTGHSPTRSPKAPNYKSRTFGTTSRRSMNCEPRTIPRLTPVLGKVFLPLRFAGTATLLFQRCALSSEAPRPRSNQTLAFGRFVMGLQEIKIESRPFEGMDHFRTAFVATWKCEPDHDASRVVPLGSPADIHFRSDSGHRRCRDTASVSRQRVRNRTAAGWRISSVVPGPEQ
jgi:hypothetical protein